MLDARRGPLISVADAAAFAGVSTSTMRGYIHRRRLIALRSVPRGRYRIPLNAIDDFLRRRPRRRRARRRR